jgi:choline dehydrogenase
MRSPLLTSLLALTGVQARVAHIPRAEQAAKATTRAGSDTKYDFIVVGSGPGGGPLAANLARDNFSVLLIEAGEDRGDSLFQQVPALHFNATHDPTQRWDYFVKRSSSDSEDAAYPYSTWKTSDGNYFVGANGPSGATRLGAYYPRTATLGGGSTSDDLVVALPGDKTWDGIASTIEDSSWGYVVP